MARGQGEGQFQTYARTAKCRHHIQSSVLQRARLRQQQQRATHGARTLLLWAFGCFFGKLVVHVIRTSAGDIKRCACSNLFDVPAYNRNTACALALVKPHDALVLFLERLTVLTVEQSAKRVPVLRYRVMDYLSINIRHANKA